MLLHEGKTMIKSEGERIIVLDRFTKKSCSKIEHLHEDFSLVLDFL